MQKSSLSTKLNIIHIYVCVLHLQSFMWVKKAPAKAPKRVAWKCDHEYIYFGFMMASSDAECDEMLSLFFFSSQLFRKVGLTFLNNSLKMAKLENPQSSPQML